MRGTFGLWSSNLRAFVGNRPIPTAKLNDLVEDLARSRPIPSQGGGVAVSQWPRGFAYRATNPFEISIAKTTTIITAASGSTLGSGSIRLETGGGTSIADPGGTPPTYTAYSNDSQEVDGGAYVVVAPFRDGYILLHARCGDLS